MRGKYTMMHIYADPAARNRVTARSSPATANCFPAAYVLAATGCHAKPQTLAVELVVETQLR